MVTPPASARPRLGVNYVPSKNWWYAWLDWDDSAIQRDLEAIAALGADHLRIQCLWPYFQPNPTFTSPLLLERLNRLLDLADTAALDVVITVFDGWLSGFDFRPAWLTPGRSMFTDPQALDAERALLAAIADAVSTHPRFLGIDVANEPNVLTGGNPVDRAAGDRWITGMLAHCQHVAPSRMHCVGVDHQPWLADDQPFSRETLATTGQITPIHSWIWFTGALRRYGPAALGTTHLAEYLLTVARAYSPDPARPVWLQEVGVAPGWVPSPEDFLDAALAAACSVPNLWGITWWCSHDVDRSLSGFADLEYDLGLLTTANEVKPLGRRFRAFADRLRSGDIEPAPPRTTALVLPDAGTPDLAFADRFMDLIGAGVHPAIVLERDTTDPPGITHLVR